MLKHYADLLRASHRLILGCALGAGLLAFTLSVVLLVGMPFYVANVAVTMEPSEEELRFNRTFMGVSQFNPATIIAQSHVERLLSRPVAERALDILTKELGGSMPPRETTIFRSLKMAFWFLWNTANYGYSVTPTDRDQMVADLQSATTVEIVEGSYILNISITYDDPRIAAMAANALAQAYVEEARAGFLRDAEEVAATLNATEEETRARFAKKRAQRQSQAAALGVNDPDAERTILLQARQDAREAQRDAEIELRGEEKRLDALRSMLARQSDVSIVRAMQESLAMGEAGLVRLTETLQQRQASLSGTDTALAALQEAEASLVSIDQEVSALETDLEQLKERRVALDLATRARLSQVLVINPATPPPYPFFPKLVVNTLIAIVAGAILGAVPVFAQDALGSEIRTDLDLHQLVGPQALPSLSRAQLLPKDTPPGRVERLLQRVSGGRITLPPRRVPPRFVETLVRRLTTDRSGWPDRRLLVTGFLPDAEIGELAEALNAASAAEGQKMKAIGLPPLTQMTDWSALSGGAVLVAMRSGAVARDELASVKQTVEEHRAEPYFMVVL